MILCYINRNVHIWRFRGNDMNKRFYKNSLKFKVLECIRQLPGNIVLRQDIEALGSPRQITRCLKDLMGLGELVKIGYGIYAKAYISEYLNKPIIKGGFGLVSKESLTKLGIKWEVGTAEQEYNAGLSTQIPVQTIIRLKSRFRARISYGNRKLIMEKGINAR